MKRPLSPQDKKALSYAKDGRNTYGESPAASRRGIRRRKAKAHRALRREVNAVVSALAGPVESDPFVARVGRKSWRKYPDAALAEAVSRKLCRRKAQGMNTRSKAGALLRQARATAVRRDAASKGPYQYEGDG